MVNTVALLTQVNPIIAAITALAISLKTIFGAAKDANPAMVVDLRDLTPYESKNAARAAGVPEEFIGTTLPEDSVLIATLLRNAGLLKTESEEFLAWTRSLQGTAPPTH